VPLQNMHESKLTPTILLGLPDLESSFSDRCRPIWIQRVLFLDSLKSLADEPRPLEQRDRRRVPVDPRTATLNSRRK
jgi:hypothetical protein